IPTDSGPAEAPSPDAVAPGTAPQPQFPVDDEPADVGASAPPPPQDGLVDRDEPPLPDDDDAPPSDDAPPYDVPPAPPTAPQTPQAPASPTPENTAPAASAPSARTAPAVADRSPGGVQRYGEAVVRQVLGATFVREEPYEPPARFA
ncbi:MAG: DNA polymerase III subunit gamma and tau, partial [Microbacterium sp.]